MPSFRTTRTKRSSTCLRFSMALTMDGNWSQYASPRMMWKEIHKHDAEIQAQRPEVWAKITKQQNVTLSDSMSQ